MFFEIIGDIREVETIAIGRSIRDLPRLRRLHGRGRWRKRKGWRRFGSRTAPLSGRNSIGMKPQELADARSRSGAS
jgi:hypothetical protein